MKPYQEKVVKEKAQLDKKITKLDAFIVSAQFKEIEIRERDLVYIQLLAMIRYSKALKKRIQTHNGANV